MLDGAGKFGAFRDQQGEAQMGYPRGDGSKPNGRRLVRFAVANIAMTVEQRNTERIAMMLLEDMCIAAECSRPRQAIHWNVFWGQIEHYMAHFCPQPTGGEHLDRRKK
jgi:hypothetical protein